MTGVAVCGLDDGTIAPPTKKLKKRRKLILYLYIVLIIFIEK